MTIWRMRIACWIPKATNIHSEYVIFNCLSTGTSVARTRLSITLYVHCLLRYVVEHIYLLWLSLFRFLIFSHLLLPDCQRCLVVDDLFITILTLLLLCACYEICILCTVCLLLGCIKFVLLPRGTHKILTLCTIQRYHTEIEIKSKDRFLATLNTKRRLLYLKTQFVPRSKHFSSRLWNPISLCCKWHKSLFVLR